MCREKTQWEKAVEFHGHECPGLAIGYKAHEAAIKKLGIRFSSDEEIVCVTENDACGVDAVQVITGCTFGKGNLLYKGTGKMAFSFFNRSNGESLRMIVKPLNEEMDRRQRQEYLLNSPAEELFNFSKPSFELPEKARLFTTVICENCGEGAPEHKMRINDGKKYAWTALRTIREGGKEMDLQYYTRLWSEGKVAKASGTSFWDNRADEFNKLVSRGTPDERIRKILEFMSNNNLLTKDSSVLDIGCGPGGFAVEFAKISSDVTGLDISAKMLDYAQKNAAAANLTNVSFKNLNWDEVNLEEYGWKKQFDLVTAINSPGIHDQVTLEKMIAASKGYCFLSNFVSRSDSVQDVIRAEILQLKDPKFYVNTVYCIFNILWLMGYYPHITYVDTDREHVRSFEEACIYYGTLFELKNGPADDQNKLIKNYLKHISPDGFVKERVRTKTAWIYWNV